MCEKEGIPAKAHGRSHLLCSTALFLPFTLSCLSFHFLVSTPQGCGAGYSVFWKVMEAVLGADFLRKLLKESRGEKPERGILKPS